MESCCYIKTSCVCQSSNNSLLESCLWNILKDAFAIGAHQFFSMNISEINKNKVAKPAEWERECIEIEINTCTEGEKTLFLFNSESATALLFF